MCVHLIGYLRLLSVRVQDPVRRRHNNQREERGCDYTENNGPHESGKNRVECDDPVDLQCSASGEQNWPRANRGAANDQLA